MHQVDLTTGQEDGRSATACSFGFAMSDLAALEQFNTWEKPGMMGVAPGLSDWSLRAPG